MDTNQTQNERLDRLIAAFETDHFSVDRDKDVFYTHDQKRMGLRAHHQTAYIDGDKKRGAKKAFYVEGSHYEMGYLLGCMAEPQIEQMCTKFNERIVLEFIHAHFRNHRSEETLGECLEIVLYWLSGNIYPDIPDEYKHELEGILDGCRAANPRTRVSWPELWVLNVGIDALLSYVYTGDLPIRKALPFKLTPKHLAIPIQCNAFSVFGPAVQDNGHFLGRDFMFPTAGIFQDTACLIVQNPQGAGGNPKQPFVSMTAPGMIGCIAGMNAQGLGAGVDMSPSGNCDPSRPGFNSTLLVRHSIENGKDCDQAVAIMEEAQRGVSWNYILAHYGDNDHHRACVVEAGCKMDDPDFSALISKYLQEHVLDLSYDHVPDQLALRLPERSFLEAPKPPEFRKGLMVRWNDYVYPETYLELNRGLFQLFGREYDPDDFMERGYIVDSWEEKHIPRRKRVPYGYYFAPQREHDAHLVLVTNMYIIPEMRLFAMHPWTNLLAASHYDNLQWRYDELNNELLDRLEDANQPLSLEEAKDAIDFLSPNPQKKNHDYYDPKPTSTCCQRLWHRLCRKFPGRHRPDPKSDHWKHIQVHGSVSLMDLKNKVIYSHYGYHGDEWVHISLKEYVDDSPEKTGV